MNLFRKRPLSLMLCVLLSGFSLLYTVPLWVKILIGSFTLLLSVAVIFTATAKKRSAVLLVSLSLLFSSLFSAIYFDAIFYPTKFYNKECEITAKVLDAEYLSYGKQELVVKVKTIDGKRAGYKLKLFLYKHAEEVVPGSVITLTSTITEFDETETFDYKHYYASRGITARLTATELTDVSEGKAPLSYTFKQMRNKICEYADKITDEDSGGLLSALLFGERDRLPTATEADYMRIGITHILSLGGFHLAILMGGLNILLYRFGKRVRTIVGCIFSFLFMLLTGFPLTVARAGFMLILSSVLVMIIGVSDSITSLFISSFIIILIQPYSALDLGFWLSVLATIGIIAAGSYFEDSYEADPFRKLLKRFFSALLFSVFAISSTSLLTAFTFSGVSLIGIPATMIFSLLLNAYIYCGIGALALGWLIPAVSVPMVRFQEFLTDFAARLSDINSVFVSSNFSVSKSLSFVLSLLFILFIVLKIKHKRIFISCIAVTYVITLLSSLGLSRTAISETSAHLYSEDGERLLIKTENRETLFVDLSGLSDDDAYYTRYMLEERHITELAHYFVPVVDEYTADSLEIVFNRIKVRRVYLPLPETDAEIKILSEITDMADNFRTEIVIYEPSSELTVGDYTVSLRERNYVRNSFVLTLSNGDSMCTYLSRGSLEYCLTARSYLFVADTVIFGNTGPNYESVYAVDEFGENLKRAIISSRSIYFDTRFMDYSPQIFKDEAVILIF